MEALQISQKTSQGLANLNALSKQALAAICKYILQMVVAGQSSISLDEEMDDALCVVSTILLEAAKAQASVDQIRATMSEFAVNGDVVNALSEVYSQHRDTLIQHMLATGISLPAIVDIDWRLDYNVRSKQGGRENQSLYFVSLKIKDRGIPRSVDIIANQEELQDMFNKVRDAVKQVERVLNTGDTTTGSA